MIIESGILGGLLGKIAAFGTGWLAVKKSREDNAHLLAMAKIETDQLSLRIDASKSMLETESAAQVDMSDFDALKTSLKQNDLAAWPTIHRDDWVSQGLAIFKSLLIAVRTLARPVTQMILLAITIRISHQLDVLALSNVSDDMQQILRMRILEEIIFLTSTSVTYLFATRPYRALK